MHQQKYKISSHVREFLRQFAQWRSEKQFEAAGPWRLLKFCNSKLEVQCNQSDMTGHSMFQAMYILAPDTPLASVKLCAPEPKITCGEHCGGKASFFVKSTSASKQQVKGWQVKGRFAATQGP
jgi:hypothetical protein